jgi:hypothetical protein
MQSYNNICGEIDKAIVERTGFIAADTPVDELRDILCIKPLLCELSIVEKDFFHAVVIEQVITTDDKGVEIASGVPLTFGDNTETVPNEEGAFGSHKLGPVTHQVRRVRMVFAAMDGEIRPFVHIEMPRSAFVHWSHRFNVGFGALSGPVGVTIK